MKERIEAVVGVLIGAPLVRMNRAASLAMFGFGRLLDGTSFRGEPRKYPEHSLHVEYCWRFIGSDGLVVVGSRDIWYPSGDPSNEPDDWQWDSPGANRFDEKSDELLRAEEAMVVQSVQGSNAGDLTIGFNGSQSLELIIDNSLPCEQWRFFSGQGGHLVVTPIGFEEDAPSIASADH
jgi:hypothetical protein